MTRYFMENLMSTRAGFVTLALVAAVSCSCSDDPSDVEGSAGTSSSAAAQIVVNEINAQGAVEWLELANNGSQPVDLGGYGLADTDKDTGLPKTGKAMRFPAGTSLPAGGYLLVLTSVDEQAPGPYLADSCLENVEAPCFKAQFGLSASSGESVHLLSPDDIVVGSTAYPKDLTPDALANQTVCRSPDRTGGFAVCGATPAAANASP